MKVLFYALVALIFQVTFLCCVARLYKRDYPRPVVKRANDDVFWAIMSAVILVLMVLSW